MEETASDPREWTTFHFDVTLDDQRIDGDIPIPVGAVRLGEMLPTFQRLTDLVVNQAVRRVEARGETISCRKGCGACCRQLVPISEDEARRIAAYVEHLPEERKQEVLARFAEIRRRLDETGNLDKLLHHEQYKGVELRLLGFHYFKLRLACPFLEDESCSIHSDRPMTCREYLVTSPAANCSNQPDDPVSQVPMSGVVSVAVMGIPVDGDRPPVRWVPLSLAPYWVAEHPDDAPTRGGAEFLQAALDTLVEDAPMYADRAKDALDNATENSDPGMDQTQGA